MITVVSGLPRSGTSLMMRMLAAGGVPILSDGERVADEDNPGGYFEWEPVKQLAQDPRCIDQAEGRAVKVISYLLATLPPHHNYKIIFMERPLPEILRSQEVMLRRRGEGEAANPSEMKAAFESHLLQVVDLLSEREDFSICRIGYRRLLLDPLSHAETIAGFLDLSLDTAAMAAQVELSLYRNRS